MTRGNRLKSALLVAVFAVVAASIVVSSAAIMLSLAGRSVSLRTVVLATLGLAGALFLLRDVIARAIIGFILRGREEEPTGIERSIERLDLALSEILEQEPEILEEASEAEKERLLLTFILWSLIDRIRQRVAPWTRKTVLLVHRHGLLYYVYPSEEELEIPEEALEIDMEDGIDAALAGDTVEVWIDSETYELLLQEIAAHKTSDKLGEHVEITSPEALEALYTIAKKIYLAINPGAPEELAAYTAYKAIHGLIRDGIIKTRIKISGLQLERRELWNRINKQIEEEEVGARGNNPNN